MTKVDLIYNPYTLNTKLIIKSKAGENVVTADSPLAFIFGRFIHNWLEPCGAWQGFFSELSRTLGDSELKISFFGTQKDFEDFSAAKVRFGEPQIEITYGLNDKAKLKVSSRQKIEKLKAYIDQVKSTIGLEDFLKNIDSVLTASFDDFCEIIFVSTGYESFHLKNAFMGRRFLNQYSNVQIKFDNSKRSFSQFAPNPNITNAKITGSSPYFEECQSKLKLVEDIQDNGIASKFIKVLEGFGKRAVLFVFNPETISADETTRAFREVAQRFNDNNLNYENVFFICTDCENITSQLSDTEGEIRKILENCGFANIKLFMLSSNFAELLRIKQYNAITAASGVTVGRFDNFTSEDEQNLTNYREILSECNCRNFYCTPVSSELKKSYDKRIRQLYEDIENYDFDLKCNVHDETERNSLELQLEAALNEIALINSNIPALEKTLIDYVDYRAEPLAILKLYTVIKNQILYQRNTLEYEIEETKKSLRILLEKNETARQPFLSTITAEISPIETSKPQFDDRDFEKLSADCIKKLHSLNAPKSSPVVEKDIYWQHGFAVKRYNADEYVNMVFALIKKTLHEISNEIETYLSKVSGNKIAKAEADKNFGKPIIHFELYQVLSYELVGVGAKYSEVRYVWVDKVFAECICQAETFLKHWLKNRKDCAKKFLAESQNQPPKTFPGVKQQISDNDKEYNSRQRAIKSKKETIQILNERLEWLRNFENQIEKILEVTV